MIRMIMSADLILRNSGVTYLVFFVLLQKSADSSKLLAAGLFQGTVPCVVNTALIKGYSNTHHGAGDVQHLNGESNSYLDIALMVLFWS